MKTTVNYVVNGKRVTTMECDSVIDATYKGGDCISHLMHLDGTVTPCWITICKESDHDKFVTYAVNPTKDETYEVKMLTYHTNEVLFRSASLGDALEWFRTNYYQAVAVAFTEIHEL